MLNFGVDFDEGVGLFRYVYFDVLVSFVRFSINVGGFKVVRLVLLFWLCLKLWNFQVRCLK